MQHLIRLLFIFSLIFQISPFSAVEKKTQTQGEAGGDVM